MQQWRSAPVLGRSKARTLGGMDSSSGLRTLPPAVAGDGHTPSGFMAVLRAEIRQILSLIRGRWKFRR
jgi:hypothetical protein